MPANTSTEMRSKIRLVERYSAPNCNTCPEIECPGSRNCGKKAEDDGGRIAKCHSDPGDERPRRAGASSSSRRHIAEAERGHRKPNEVNRADERQPSKQLWQELADHQEARERGAEQANLSKLDPQYSQQSS